MQTPQEPSRDLLTFDNILDEVFDIYPIEVIENEEEDPIRFKLSRNKEVTPCV